MAVRANDAVACGHKAFFGQQRVLDAHFPHIVEIQDIVFVRKHAALPGLLCGLDVLIGDEMVHHQADLCFVEYGVKARLFKFVDGHGAGDVVAQHHIQLCHDELARYNGIQHGMRRQNHLRH